MDESITKKLRELIEENWPHPDGYWREGGMMFAPSLDAIADRIYERYDALKSDDADLQARLDASMPLPVDADGVPCTCRHVAPKPETIEDVRKSKDDLVAFAVVLSAVLERAYECGMRDSCARGGYADQSVLGGDAS